MNKSRIVAFGECMLELRKPAGGEYRATFSGDVFNTAVYAKRIGGEAIEVAFATAVGVDAISADMLEFIASEQVDASLILKHAYAVPGIYAINTDQRGERNFTYWRDKSAARDYFDIVEEGRCFAEGLGGGDILYFSGITLAVLNEAARKCLFDVARGARASGAKIAFDPNYRARLWQDKSSAHAAFETAYRLSDIVLPGVEDETLLGGSGEPNVIIDRLAALGPGEIVLKCGRGGVVGRAGEKAFAAPFAAAPRIVDSTAAGDGFNAAYLVERLKGTVPDKAARRAARTAAFIVGFDGAITPSKDFQKFLDTDYAKEN